MKTLDFSYYMELKFDEPVSGHHFTIKCMPQTTARQRIEELRVDVYPNRFLSFDEDSFGNKCIYGHMEDAHDHFEIRMEGRAVTGLAPAETGTDEVHAGMFRYQTQMTQPGREILALAKSVSFAPEASDYEKACRLMQKLHDQFAYVPGVTCVETTAEEALALGKGVCQDYTHIMLSLCRIHQIPAKYAVGLLEGEGQSHAWIEVWSDGGFFPLDPTNNCIVGDSHIHISSGRDYKDCMINQGIFTGTARQEREIHALVTQAEQ